jgi:FkbM family methyltransferase
MMRFMMTNACEGARGTAVRRVAKLVLAHAVPKSVYLFVNARIAARDIAAKRRWAPEIAYLPKFVHSGDVAVDVGACHGLYTYHLSQIVGPSGAVYAFEPIPPNLRILNRTIKTHGLRNVTVYPKACGDCPGTKTFYVSIDYGIPQLGASKQGSGGLTFTCEVVRLDDVIQSKVRFLKVDVEGAELLVFRGAERILRESRPAILFEAGNHTRDFGYEQQTVFDFLSNLGYRFCSGGWKGKALEPRERFTDEEDYFCSADLLAG